MKKVTTLLCGTALALGFVASAAQAQVTDDDKKFLAMAAQSDQNEIALSTLAESKATNPDVKKFAMTMVKQHKMLTSKMKPFATAWGLTPPTGPDADAKKEWDKLNGMSGADFDKEYMDEMVSDHAKALDAFTKEVNDTKDAKFKAAVESGKNVVAAHKNMAYDLKKKL